MRLAYPNEGFLKAETLAGCIDHAVLAPDHSVEDIERACEEAIAYGFATVTVAPYDVARAAVRLAGSGTAVGGTVGIPLGHSGLRGKTAEALTCVDAGAGEVDMVVNLMAAKSHLWGDVRNEVAAIRRITDGRILKVILECCYLTDEEKVRVSEIAVETGADFVKTSTGFGPGGATVADVALLKQTVGRKARVKAAGGIRTFAQAAAMLQAGASRIGTSTGAAIIHDFLETRTAAHHG
jgi:deoxyribose-phosphate aldolase